jgi:hypothetical protein
MNSESREFQVEGRTLSHMNKHGFSADLEWLNPYLPNKQRPNHPRFPGKRHAHRIVISEGATVIDLTDIVIKKDEWGQLGHGDVVFQDAGSTSH